MGYDRKRLCDRCLDKGIERSLECSILVCTEICVGDSVWWWRYKSGYIFVKFTATGAFRVRCWNFSTMVVWFDRNKRKGV